MSEGKRFPTASLLMMLLILTPLVFSVWWFNRPGVGTKPPPPAIEDLDLVSNGRVDLEEPIVSLEPNQPGKVLVVYVKEGEKVEAGQPILKMDDSMYASALIESKAAIAAAQVEVDSARWKEKQNPTQLSMQEKKVAVAESQHQAITVKLTQMKSQAKATDKVTMADVDIMEANLTAQKAMWDGEKLLLQQLKSWDPSLESKAAEARLATAKAAADRVNKAVADCVLKSPKAGTILRLSTGPGATISQGMPFPPVIFAPTGPYIVRAEFEQGGLGRLREGMIARVRDDTRAELTTWEGKVKRVGDWVAPRRSILLEPGEINDVRTVEVIVEVQSKPGELWIGQRVQVRVMAKGNDRTANAKSPGID